MILLASAPVSFSKGLAHISRATFSGATACLKHMASIHDSCLPLAGLEPPPLPVLEEWPWSCAGDVLTSNFSLSVEDFISLGEHGVIQDRLCSVSKQSHTEGFFSSTMGSFFQQLSCVCTAPYRVWCSDSKI